MAVANRRLEQQLLNHGLIPNTDRQLSDQEFLLLKARQAAIQALRVYNDPTALFKIESFMVSMHIAWSCILQAIVEKRGGNPYYRDKEGNVQMVDGTPRTKSVSDLAADVFDLGSADGQATKKNLDILIGLRDRIEHRYVPALDTYMVHEIQAMLLNFEHLLVDEFGIESALAGQLHVPLMLSMMRPGSSFESLKALQSKIPQDVIDYLEDFAGSVPPEVKENNHFRLKIFLMSVSANHEKSADTVMVFYRESEVPEELQDSLSRLGLVTKFKQVQVDDPGGYLATTAQLTIQDNLPHRFSLNDHVRAWKFFGVRPPEGAENKAETIPEYCVYNTTFRRYSYKEAWIAKLSQELSDPKRFEEVTGHRPRPKN